MTFNALQGNGFLSDDAFFLHELYCSDKNCDCQRVLLNAFSKTLTKF